LSPPSSTVHTTAEVKRFNELRKGDQVVVTITDANAVSLKKIYNPRRNPT
jgi:hypothetical protein